MQVAIEQPLQLEPCPLYPAKYITAYTKNNPAQPICAGFFYSLLYTYLLGIIVTALKEE